VSTPSVVLPALVHLQRVPIARVRGFVDSLSRPGGNATGRGTGRVCPLSGDVSGGGESPTAGVAPSHDPHPEGATIATTQAEFWPQGKTSRRREVSGLAPGAAIALTIEAVRLRTLVGVLQELLPAKANFQEP
jgi:hypothetical protein